VPEKKYSQHMPSNRPPIAEAIEEMNLDGKPVRPQSSLAKRRQKDAEKFASRLFRELKSNPVLKERELTDEERETLISDYLADEPIPASLKGLAREIAKGVAERVAGGNRLEADTYAREQAVGFTDALLNTAWSGEDDAGFDTRAVAANIHAH
jgi:hypothetical protein